MSRKHSDRRTTSRRTFLKTSAGLAAGASLPAPASAQDATGARPADPELADLQSQKRILLKGGVVLTMDPQVGHFANADVLIEDGKIREVRPNIAVASAATIDATGRIIVPGFVDTHSHSYQGILRNILTNGRVDPDYNRDIVARITPAYTPEDAYVGMLATALGMIDMGTTCVVDVSQVNNTPEHSDRIRAFARSSPIQREPRGLACSIRRISCGSKGRISARGTSCLPSRSASVPIRKCSRSRATTTCRLLRIYATHCPNETMARA
jgi:hypothetical protein